jgi:hypothetical protein
MFKFENCSNIIFFQKLKVFIFLLKRKNKNCKKTTENHRFSKEKRGNKETGKTQRVQPA